MALGAAMLPETPINMRLFAVLFIIIEYRNELNEQESFAGQAAYKDYMINLRGDYV